MTLRRGASASAWEITAIALLAGVGAALRCSRLDLGWFGIDQARDVTIALDVAAGRDFPLVGPTMRRVVRLGALYHYFWALPYLGWRDPIAGYWFAALLGIGALFLTWALARRTWGARAALVTLAAGATDPIWVIDTRVYWAPAALPLVAAVVAWLVLGGRTRTPPAALPLSTSRMATLGAVLGLAVQLHLSMVGVVAAVGAVVALERPRWRPLLAGALIGTFVAAPALAAFLWQPAGEGGVAALAARAAGAGVGTRAVALFALPLHVAAAFDAGPEARAGGGPLAITAALVLGAAALVGVLRLTLAAACSERRARALVLLLLVPTVMVLGLPGDVWYYYLDATLPLRALAIGAAAAPGRSRAVDAVALTLGALAIVAALVLGAHMAGWLRRVHTHGYMSVEPAPLTLDGRPGRDAAVPGRVVTVGAKRAVAAATAAAGLDLPASWRHVHGPARADAFGDNGFWLRWYLARQGALRGGPDVRHLAIFYREHPLAAHLQRAPAAPAPTRDETVETVSVGPFVIARYPTAIDYGTCRSEGAPLAVPVRVLPDPKRYGDGTPEVPPRLPRAVECALAPGGGRTLVVASLSGAGTVTLASDAGERSAPARESTLCVRRGPAPVPVRLEIEPGEGGGGELDLYDLPLGVGCEG